MINTYNIDNKVWETIGNTNTMKELRAAYVDMGSTASILSAENQALRNAMIKNLDEKMIKKIEKDTEIDLHENYYWRNTTKEEINCLNEYGYTKPIALLEDVEEAYDVFDEGLPVFLLHRDGTETLATKGIDIERHAKEGGLLGTTQFAYEKQEEIYLELND